MSVQLQELIDKIKNDGVKEAKEEALKIKEKAEREVEQIIAEAKQQSKQIKEKAESEAYQFESSSKEAVKQAARDIALGLKAEIVKLFDAILKQEVKKSLSADVLKETILTILKSWAKEQEGKIDVVLSEKDFKQIKEYLFLKIGDELLKGIEIKSSSHITSGFKITEKDGSAFYDFTEEGISEILAEHLNPKIVKALEGK
jgi:V/A-type H+-transporting ATPase subunit E